MVLHLKVDYVSVCVQLVGRQIVSNGHHPQGIYVSPCVFVEGLRDILCECL